MLFLAATLFFSPHYAVTHEQGPTSIVGDANGNACVVSGGNLSKIDPDGRVAYRLGLGSGVLATPDSQGNVYAAVDGYAYQTNERDIQTYAIKLDADGKLVYSVPLRTTSARAPAVGADGSAYFTGMQWPEEWMPTTPNAWVSTASAAKRQTNAFVVKISPAGDRIVYATLLNNAPASSGPASGYPPYATGAAIAVDDSGAAYVVGATSDPSYPVTDAAFQKQCPRYGFGSSIFVTKLSPDGSALAYSTFLGAADDAYFPMPVVTRVDGSHDLEVLTVMADNTIRARTVRADGGALVLDATLDFRGTKSDHISVRAIPDGDGNLWVSGPTGTLNLPTTEGALQDGPTTIALIRTSDAAVLYSTRLPFASPQGATLAGMALDGSGGLLVLGGAGNYTHAAQTLTRLVRVGQAPTSLLGVANAAEDNVSAAIAPGEIVNLYGVNLGTATRIDGSFSEGGPLPYALAGTEVRFNGIPAPLVSVADQQVVAEVPFGIAGSRTVEIELVHNGESSNIATVPGAAVEPQVLQSGPDSSGQRYAAALNQDGTVNGPHNPATAGSVVSIYLNGAGVLSPLPQDGAPGTADQTLPAPVSIVVGVGIAAAVPAQVLYAGAAPGLAGLMQLNFQVPSPYSRLVFGGGSASRFWVEIGGVSTTYSHFWVAPP